MLELKYGMKLTDKEISDVVRKVMNGWITIHPNGEGHKGRHLYIGEGESLDEAMRRTFGENYDDKSGSFDFGGTDKQTKEQKESQKQQAKKDDSKYRKTQEVIERDEKNQDMFYHEPDFKKKEDLRKKREYEEWKRKNTVVSEKQENYINNVVKRDLQDIDEKISKSKTIIERSYYNNLRDVRIKDYSNALGVSEYELKDILSGKQGIRVKPEKKATREKILIKENKQPEKRVNGYGEKTSRYITSSTYERAQKRLKRDVENFLK